MATIQKTHADRLAMKASAYYQAKARPSNYCKAPCDVPEGRDLIKAFDDATEEGADPDEASNLIVKCAGAMGTAMSGPLAATMATRPSKQLADATSMGRGIYKSYVKSHQRTLKNGQVIMVGQYNNKVQAEPYHAKSDPHNAYLDIKPARDASDPYMNEPGAMTEGQDPSVKATIAKDALHVLVAHRKAMEHHHTPAGSDSVGLDYTTGLGAIQEHIDKWKAVHESAVHEMHTPAKLANGPQTGSGHFAMHEGKAKYVPGEAPEGTELATIGHRTALGENKTKGFYLRATNKADAKVIAEAYYKVVGDDCPAPVQSGSSNHYGKEGGFPHIFFGKTEEDRLTALRVLREVHAMHPAGEVDHGKTPSDNVDDYAPKASEQPGIGDKVFFSDLEKGMTFTTASGEKYIITKKEGHEVVADVPAQKISMKFYSGDGFGAWDQTNMSYAGMKGDEAKPKGDDTEGFHTVKLDETVKPAVKTPHQMGMEAHAQGKGPAPIASNEFMAAHYQKGEVGGPQSKTNMDKMDEYAKGWHKANLAAPVPESEPEATHAVAEAKQTGSDGKYYHGGDEIEYTGKTQDIHGGAFHEFTFKDGHKAGQTGLTAHGPQEGTQKDGLTFHGGRWHNDNRDDHQSEEQAIEAAKAAFLAIDPATIMVDNTGKEWIRGSFDAHATVLYPAYGGMVSKEFDWAEIQAMGLKATDKLDPEQDENVEAPASKQAAPKFDQVAEGTGGVLTLPELLSVGKEWKSDDGSKHRVYFNGLKEHNGGDYEGMEKGAKVWFDMKTGKFAHKGMTPEKAMQLLGSILKKAKEAPASQDMPIYNEDEGNASEAALANHEAEAMWGDKALADGVQAAGYEIVMGKLGPRLGGKDGYVKTFANLKQAVEACQKLDKHGIEAHVSAFHPFTVLGMKLKSKPGDEAEKPWTPDPTKQSDTDFKGKIDAKVKELKAAMDKGFSMEQVLSEAKSESVWGAPVWAAVKTELEKHKQDKQAITDEIASKWAPVEAPGISDYTKAGKAASLAGSLAKNGHHAASQASDLSTSAHEASAEAAGSKSTPEDHRKAATAHAKAGLLHTGLSGGHTPGMDKHFEFNGPEAPAALRPHHALLASAHKAIMQGHMDKADALEAEAKAKQGIKPPETPVPTESKDKVTPTNDVVPKPAMAKNHTPWQDHKWEKVLAPLKDAKGNFSKTADAMMFEGSHKPTKDELQHFIDHGKHAAVVAMSKHQASHRNFNNGSTPWSTIAHSYAHAVKAAQAKLAGME